MIIEDESRAPGGRSDVSDGGSGSGRRRDEGKSAEPLEARLAHYRCLLKEMEAQRDRLRNLVEELRAKIEALD